MIIFRIRYLFEKFSDEFSSYNNSNKNSLGIHNRLLFLQSKYLDCFQYLSESVIFTRLCSSLVHRKNTHNFFFHPCCREAQSCCIPFSYLLYFRRCWKCQIPIKLIQCLVENSIKVCLHIRNWFVINVIMNTILILLLIQR